MKNSAVLVRMVMVLFFVCGMVNPCRAGFKMEINEQTKGEIGIWMQASYQWVEDGKVNDSQFEDVNDFMIRRAYMYLKADVTKYVSFFTHLASDKVGFETPSEGDLDKSGLGLGSGVAWRDLWITVNLHEAFKIQMGRMYVPLTRNYGTTSTKCMLTADLPFLQGGSRGGIFYAQKVGRDDGLTLWGNPMDGHLHYRFMISEGVEDNDGNPEDNLRFVGRLSVSLLEPETSWFTKGTYLGKKKVLSLGFGMDSQDDLTLGGIEDRDNTVWTVDAFFDHPLGAGAVTLEAAYIDIDNCTQGGPNFYHDLEAGDDAENWYINVGYLLPGSIGPGRLQPYIRYETVDVDNKNETDFWSGGFNYYLKGHNCKLTADYMRVDPDNPDKDERDIFTFQITIGF
ncbi:MAG: selenite/tellurite reduction operon porin ExtI [Desulfobacterales bacterium]